jgi:hypothetical protein
MDEMAQKVKLSADAQVIPAERIRVELTQQEAATLQLALDVARGYLVGGEFTGAQEEDLERIKRRLTNPA